MSNLGEAIEKKGISDGIKTGKFLAAALYCRRGNISVEEAAAYLEMTAEEFIQKMNQLSAEDVSDNGEAVRTEL